MASPYVSQSASGYNSGAPADDGSQVASNRIKWDNVKSKIGDPLKTFSDAINTANVTAFGKVAGGFVSTAISYQVTSNDQGKAIKATASGITITTPDATDVGTPFRFRAINSSSGDITLDGSGTQTIDGALTATISAGRSLDLDTDGSNWFSGGAATILVGNQLQYASIINGTIVESNSANAVTFALKTLAGNDPSSTDPVLLCFRNSTLATGNYVYRTVTAALSLVISSGSTLGATNGVAFRVWIVIFDDAGTIRLGAINCVSGTNIYPLGRVPRVSSTAEGGAGAADSAQVFYTGTAVTSKPYIIFAHADYESGLAAAGSWNVDPTLQLFGYGVPLPGQEIQRAENITGAVATGTTVIPDDDTIPQNTEGDQYLTQAITPSSATSILRIESQIVIAHSAGNATTGMALFQDSTASSLAATRNALASTGAAGTVFLSYSMRAGTASSTTFNIRAGSNTAGTTTFNGVGGSRKWGGVLDSYLSVKEIMT